MSEGLLGAFLTTSAIFVAVASLRRAFRDTSHSHFHKAFSRWRLPEGFDEGEKLQRIGVVLDFLMQAVRAAWFAIWIAYRYDAAPYYWVGEWKLASWLGLLATAVELLAMSLVFFDFLPQVLVSLRGRALAVTALPILFRIETVLSPFTKAFLYLCRALVRGLGISQERTGTNIAEERILAAVEIGEWEGALREGEKSMIESVLEFHDVEVTEVMTPRTEMVCMDATLTVEAALDPVIECGHSRIPVYREDIDDISGVLYAKDLLRHQRAGDVKRTLGEIARKVNFVPESKKISELLAEFRKQRFHIAVILDEYGGTSGLVTIEDIIEEIVGEIDDEFDSHSATLIRRVDAATFELDGRAPIDEVNEALHVALPERDDYATIAGFLLATLGKVPKEGEVVLYENLQFRITSANERRIRRVRACVREREAEEQPIQA
ncbi:MAG: hemolysin family protein [Planctomycetes bacterium]|nr:hemolysin family protein [Planctomycetota bacterium]